MKVENVTVIVRAAGERTEKACLALLEQQVPKENIFILHEKPFKKAVRRTFEIGLEQNLSWTLAIDADILPRKNAILEMVNHAEKLKKTLLDKLYVYQGYMICKILPFPRHGGLHLYQTKFLNHAIDYIPAHSEVLRPESYTYKKMNEAGYIHFMDDKIYSIHDYEQYYADLLRKAFFHAKKFFNAETITKSLLVWQERKSLDYDYQIILKGWTHGILDDSEVTVDIDFFRKKVQQIFELENYQEKKELTFVDPDELFQMVEDHIVKADFKDLKIKIRPHQFNDFQKLQSKIGTALVLLGQLIKARI